MADQRSIFRPWVLEPMPLGMNCKPWYNDKLPSRCFAKHKNRLLKFPTSLDSRQWIFVREGLDDFRKCCPPAEGLITRGPKEGFLPIISHRVPQPAPKTSRGKPSKEAGLFSTLSPAQLARKAFIEDIEAHLTERPLVLYPNVEEDIPADLLLKVLEVLDPERKLKETWAYCEGERKSTRKPMKLCKRHSRKVFPGSPKTTESHPEDLIQEEEPSTADVDADASNSRYVSEGILDFCEWVSTFGDFGINKDFILNQFDIASECKPTYEDVCMKKVNLVSSELKYNTELSQKEEIQFSIEREDWERKLQKPLNPYKPNWVKIRYGAWYLKPRLWKKLINDEPLIDPKVLLETQGRSFGKPPEYDILEDLYGTIAFKDFIISKGYRMPYLLERLFTRKGWSYDAVQTPIPRMMQKQAILESKVCEDDYKIL
ncbi:protein FAM47A-like [Carlito syrichta]|uniref:Protein FAM47A-like n=1 Tax=Carlito syrichta TaxID=1868482 RepID=A0A1U7UFZ4_CARSF|nr:protein FAM47A-like [Carlito syrichta]